METSQVKGYFTNEDKFIPKGEYKPTSVDEYKASVDFLILSCGNRYAISFNKPIELKCNLQSAGQTVVVMCITLPTRLWHN